MMLHLCGGAGHKFLSQFRGKEGPAHGIDGSETRGRRYARKVFDLDGIGFVGEASAAVEETDGERVSCNAFHVSQKNGTLSDGVEIGLECMKDVIQGCELFFFRMIERRWRFQAL